MCLTVFPLFMSKSELLALLFSKRVTVNELLPSLFKKGSICYFSRANRSFTHKKQAICSKNQRANFQPWLQRKWLFSSTEEMTFLFFQGNGFSKLLRKRFSTILITGFSAIFRKTSFPPPEEMAFLPSQGNAFSTLFRNGFSVFLKKCLWSESAEPGKCQLLTKNKRKVKSLGFPTKTRWGDTFPKLFLNIEGG